MRARLLLVFLSAFCLLLPSLGYGQLAECAVQVGPLLPDLIVSADKMKAQMIGTEETFSATGCTVREGCVDSPGTHLLLRFTSTTPNVGQTDLVVGDPHNCFANLFQFSECHQHLHFQEYADYRLWTVAGYQNWVARRDLRQPTGSGKNAKLLENARRNGELIVGRKQGFCVIDIVPFKFDGVTPPPPKFVSCGSNQGISVGYADEYIFQLACQFIQMTGVAEGDYILEDQVNPEQLFPESDYTNNSAAVKFHWVPKQGRSGPSVIVDSSF